MKNRLALLINILLTATLLAQTPEKIIETKDTILMGKVLPGGNSFSQDSKQPGLATMTNSAQNEDKILSKIYFYSITNGTQRFGIGSLDQRNWGIVKQEFEIEVKKGFNEISVLKHGYRIPRNEQLFTYYHDSEKTETLSWHEYASTDDNTSNMVCGSASGVLNPIATKYGGYINLKYELVSIDSPFAIKTELESVKETAQEAYALATKVSNGLGFVTDRSGKKYKLVVINSQLQVIPLEYKNVLVLSNSYGMHGRVFSYGWGGNRGMASSVKENDFVHLLERGLKQKDTSAVVDVVNVAVWERDFEIDKSNLLDSFLTPDVDCIVFDAGGNVVDDNGFSSALVELMDYCFSKVPSADGYINSRLFPSAVKDNALSAAADALNLTYVNCAVSNQEDYTSRMGDYVWGDYTADNGSTWNEDIQVMYPIAHNGVASHPGDNGMLHIANSILDAMQYPQLNLSHNIIVNDISNIGYTCFNKWVEGGVFNIHTTADNVLAVDKNGNALKITDHNDGVFSLIMPDSDVKIIISK